MNISASLAALGLSFAVSVGTDTMSDTPVGLTGSAALAREQASLSMPETAQLRFGPERSKIHGLSMTHLEDGLFVLEDDQSKPIYEFPIKFSGKIPTSPPTFLLTEHWLVGLVQLPGVPARLVVFRLPTESLDMSIPNLFPTDDELEGIEKLPIPPFMGPLQQSLKDADDHISQKLANGEYLGASDMKSDRREVAKEYIDDLNRCCRTETLLDVSARPGRPTVQEKQLKELYKASPSPDVARTLNTIWVRDWIYANLGPSAVERLFDGMQQLKPTRDSFEPYDNRYSADDITFDRTRALGYRVFVRQVRGNYPSSLAAVEDSADLLHITFTHDGTGEKSVSHYFVSSSNTPVFDWIFF